VRLTLAFRLLITVRLTFQAESETVNANLKALRRVNPLRWNRRTNPTCALHFGKELTVSAFIVGNKTINHVTTWLSHSDNSFERRKVLSAVGISEADEQWDAKLGLAMLAMNVQAVDARYGENQAQQFRTLEFIYIVRDLPEYDKAQWD
jgi:hypothetical protein